MGRPATFDPQDKLHQAMKVFWRYGYEATSVQMLCDALKLNRFSIYNAFGDKETLLNLALDHYGNTVTRRIQEPCMSRVEGSMPSVVTWVIWKKHCSVEGGARVSDAGDRQ